MCRIGIAEQKSIEIQITSPSINYVICCVETDQWNQSKQFNEIEMPCIFLATDKIWNIFLPMFVSCCFPLCIEGTNSIPKYLARVLIQSMDWGCTLSLIKNWFLASRFNKIDRRLISNQVIHHTGVSKNSGIPKWMVKIMENPTPLEWMIWGYLYFWKHPYRCFF